MRFTSLTAASAITCLVLSGIAQPASAYPINDQILTANTLYRTGKLPQGKCPEREIKPNDIAAAKRYLTAVVTCLNQSWGARFKQAGLPFAEAKIGFIAKPRKYCGVPWGEAVARYCGAERRLLVQLKRSILDDPSDLFLFALAAHEYGHHVQNLTGIRDAFDRHAYRNKSELDQQSRRKELQAECLGGVFIGSVWDSLRGRGKDDWKILVKLARLSGDEGFRVRSHGKGRNIASWLDKGFRARSPQACNTWTASSSSVS